MEPDHDLPAVSVMAWAPAHRRAARTLGPSDLPLPSLIDFLGSHPDECVQAYVILHLQLRL